MARLAIVKNVPADRLDDYNPERYDAKPNGDGTFDLIPVRWWDQASFNEAEYGCGEPD